MLEERFPLNEEQPPRWSDKRAELTLGALVCCVLALLGVLFAFVFVQGWPSFAHNGLAWFGSGGNVDDQIRAIYNSGEAGTAYVWTFHAWPLIWSTILIVGGAVLISIFCSLFVAVFVVEFAPEPMKRILQPVLRLLASVPSVIFGLLGVLVVVPYHRQPPHHAIREGFGRLRHLAERQQPARRRARPHGDDHAADDRDLRRRPALGAERLDRGLARARRQPLAHLLEDRGPGRPARRSWPAPCWPPPARSARRSRSAWSRARSASRPTRSTAPIFFFEPSRPLAATIIQNAEGIDSLPLKHTLFAIAAVLLVSVALLSLAGWAAKQPLRRYGIV